MLESECAAGYPQGTLYWNDVASDIIKRVLARHASAPARPMGGTLSRKTIGQIRDYVLAFVDCMREAPSSGCAIVTHDFKGAASRVAPDATAFALRRDHALVEIIAAVADNGDGSAEDGHCQWAYRTRQSFAAAALPGGYPNLLGRGDVERAKAAFGGNAARLVRAKRRYDPANTFRSAIPLPTD